MKLRDWWEVPEQTLKFLEYETWGRSFMVFAGYTIIVYHVVMLVLFPTLTFYTGFSFGVFVLTAVAADAALGLLMAAILSTTALYEMWDYRIAQATGNMLSMFWAAIATSGLGAFMGGVNLANYGLWQTPGSGEPDTDVMLMHATVQMSLRALCAWQMFTSLPAAARMLSVPYVYRALPPDNPLV